MTKVTPLALQEQAGNDGMTHMAVITSDDLTQAMNNTAQTVKLVGLNAGDIILKVVSRIATPFRNTADSAFNGSAFTVGDTSSVSYYLGSTQANGNAGVVYNDGATNSNTTLTSASAAFVAGDVGQPISGAGIPAGTTIASVTNGTTVVLSAAATATATSVTITLGNRTSVPVAVPEGQTTTPGGVYAAADELDVTFNAMSGKNLNALNRGELHLFFRLLRPKKLSDVKGAAVLNK